ncbi:hypothetical protein [Clostridium gallinarum]|uniref:hypothetical protein n=1 Tax=Clostridium gallinarum TaxID=2762246 RepID=UPI00311AA043
MKNLRYIGPYFRMNKLSHKEINGQLFHLSKEAIRTLVLESKCGLVDSIKSYKKLSSSIDITTSTNFSPLLCIYRKSSPNYIHSKNYNGFDEESFKKDISPATNALLTTSILNLSTYYSRFKDVDEKLYAYSEAYKKLSKKQLEFYSINLRNNEGIFIEKRNLSENNYKGFNLVDKNNKFKFSDQAFMMVSYNLYSILYPGDETSIDYNNFSLEILQTLVEFKEKIYDCSFEEICKILLAINMFYSNSKNNDAKILIIDLTDFLINKFDEKDYYIDELDFTSLFVINLLLSFKHTQMITFNEKAKEILNKLLSLYDNDKEAFLKLSSKKELKYSCFDIAFYFLAIFMYAKEDSREKEYKNMISSLYRKYFINSGIITSWPDAPTLDDAERYRGLTFNSTDMLEENFFKMITTSTPSSLGIAPVFRRNVTYSKKKDSFSSSNSSFDSYKNIFIYQLIIFLFKDEFMLETSLPEKELYVRQIEDEKFDILDETPLDNDSKSELTNDIPEDDSKTSN